MLSPGGPIKEIPGNDRPRQPRQISEGKIRRLPIAVTAYEYHRLEKEIKRWYFPETNTIQGMAIHRLRKEIPPKKPSGRPPKVKVSPIFPIDDPRRDPNVWW